MVLIGYVYVHYSRMYFYLEQFGAFGVTNAQNFYFYTPDHLVTTLTPILIGNLQEVRINNGA